MEEKVKELIRKSLLKRLVGHGNIDNISPNSTLIEHWVTAIMALGYNDNEVEAASADINEIQASFMGVFSIEDTRAFVFFTQNRFPDEIAAFMKYVELRDDKSEEIVLYAVEEELEYVEPGDFMLS